MKSKKPKLRVIEPHGFCSGVTNAVKTARSTLLSVPDERVYCLHQLVHNDIVVGELSRLGMVTVEDIGDVPDGSCVLFSAHGVSPQIRDAAAAKGLRVVDTTCPFVARVHKEALRAAQENMKVVVVGDSNHIEVRGVEGEVRSVGGDCAVVRNSGDIDKLDWPEDVPVKVVVQTTLSETDVESAIAGIVQRFPSAATTRASCVCTATHDRQKAVRDFVEEARKESYRDIGVLVLGSPKSANTNRLAEIAEAAGAKAWRCSSLEEVGETDFSDVSILGVTAGASTPEALLESVVSRFGG